MSITTDQPGTAVSTDVPDLTFKQRLAQRRKELEDTTSIDIQVPGYENLYARYRVLGYEEGRDIARRVTEEADGNMTTIERLNAASSLAEACEELLEYKGRDPEGKPVFESTGYRWGAPAARDLFDANLPDGAIARDAVMAVFPYPRDTLMMTHYETYLGEAMGFLPEIERILQGESLAASAVTTSDSSQQPQ